MNKIFALFISSLAFNFVNAQCAPGAMANPSLICSGQTTTLTASGGTSYTWTPGGMTASSVVVSPTSNTVYTLTAATGTCVASATVQVNVYASPSVIASNNGPVCVNSPLSLSASGTGGGLTYSWSGPNAYSYSGPNPSLGSAISGMSGAYNVTVTDFNGCHATSTTTVIVNPLPVVTVSSNSPVCDGNTIWFNSSSTGIVSWSWSGPNGYTATQQNPSISYATTSMAGTYMVTVTDANGCVNSNSTSVVVNPNPVVVVNSATTCAGSTTTLSANGASTYTWNTGETGASIVVSPSANATYTVVGTDMNACSDTAYPSVSVTPIPSLTLTASPAVMCSGQTSTLTASGAATFSWSANAGGSSANAVSVTPNATTTYTVAGTMNGCSDSTTITVSVSQSPTISVSATTTNICAGNSATLTASGAPSYTWMPGPVSGASIVVSPNSTTTYTVAGSNGGCTDSALITVSVTQTPTLSVTASSATVCAGQSATLTASGAMSYTWSANAGSAQTNTVSVTPFGPATYTVVGDNIGCVSMQVINVYGVATPTIVVSVSPTVICTGDSVVLMASGASTLTWVPSAGLSSTTGFYVPASPSSTTSYTVVGTNANGCTNSAVATVSVNPSPLVSFTLQADVVPHVWNALAVYSGGTPPYTVSWNWGDGNSTSALYPTHSYSAAGTYSICATITDANGCIASFCQNDSVYRLASSTMVQINVINASAGINTISKNVEMKLYPNPANVGLIVDGFIFGGTISLYNSLGELVLEQHAYGSSIKVDVGSLREGIYFVSVQSTNKVFTQKIIIRR